MRPAWAGGCLTAKRAALSIAANASVDAGANADLADVERVLAGAINAFESIVRRWQGPPVNMASRYCDRRRAEEMAQEALVRAWRGLKQWRRDISPGTCDV